MIICLYGGYGYLNLSFLVEVDGTAATVTVTVLPGEMSPRRGETVRSLPVGRSGRGDPMGGPAHAR